MHGRVAVCDFDEGFSRLGYAGSDFMLMPSRFEPCGLPQMVSPKYGTFRSFMIQAAFTIRWSTCIMIAAWAMALDFQHYGPQGLRWGIDEAIGFYRRPKSEKRGYPLTHYA